MNGLKITLIKDYQKLVESLCQKYDDYSNLEDPSIQLLVESHIDIFLQFSQQLN